jgi:hypothetical protein
LINSYSTSVNSPDIGSVTLTASGVENSVFSLSSITNSTEESGLGNTISNMLSSFSNAISDMINGILSTISYFIVYTFILPAFSLMITGISVREIAELLGSEASFGMFRMLG